MLVYLPFFPLMWHTIMYCIHTFLQIDKFQLFRDFIFKDHLFFTKVTYVLESIELTLIQ